LAHSGSVTPALPRETPSPTTADRDRRGRIAARFVIAVAASGIADTLWWFSQPRQLTGPINIVGYPAFKNFDYIPSFLAYRLITYALPLGALVVYSLLAWRGPLARPAGTRRRRAAALMLDLPPAEPAAEPAAGPVTGPAAGPAAGKSAEPAVEAAGPVAGQALAAAARLLLPAMVVVVAAGAASTSRSRGITALGLIGGVAYLAGVPVLAGVIAWLRARPSPPRWAQVRPAIAAVNGIGGAMASVWALWFVSQHSVVEVLSDHRAHHWPWLPSWLAGLGMVVIAAWGAARLRGGRSAAAVEKRLLAVVVGGAAVFLATSRMPGRLGSFGGFDDAQYLVGGHLLSQGYFPWRDLMFIHGLWTDALRATVGFAIFGNTRWGGVAGGTVLLGPLCWVIVYLFAVWASRRNRWFLIGLVILVLSGIPDALDGRFMLVPVILILLGEMLRRRSAGWCAAFMLVLFSQVILVPETLFLALPALLTVVAADLTHRPAGSGIWPALRRSQWCAAAGGAAIVAWCAFLAANHSLGAWIEYFKIFGPGHSAEGALPPRHIPPRYWIEFGLGIALVLVTFWSAVARVRGGRPWSPRDWVTVAAAGFTALYGEQALGRFDMLHIDYVFTAAVPLMLLWSEQALTAADRLVRTIASGIRRDSPLRGALATHHPATVLAMAISVVLAGPLTGVPSTLTAAEFIPAREHAASEAGPTVPRLGYVAPDALDPSLLPDLAAALDAYAGKGRPVFDMTNSPGYFYYLLDRRPASRFVHVSMAITPYSQQLLNDSLRQSRPPVVIFDSVTIGMAVWDGIRNNIRHYDVSRYLLDNYRPILETHGVLLMLRNDLMARRPPLPRLIIAPVTTDLYFRSSACDWGTIPSFLSSPASGSSVQVPVTWGGRGRKTGVAEIPAGVTIADYGLLTLHADGPIGPSEVTISDRPGASARHDIIASVLRSSGATLGIRVGSCLQWHGYRTRTLYITQTSGAPVSRLQLSGVGD
jgi:hypothetical protein